MKKLITTIALFILAINSKAQILEDDVSVGGIPKMYGNYKGAVSSNSSVDKNTVAINGTTIITGTVIKIGWCEEDCITFWLKKEDGTTLVVGTKDFGFSVPKSIVRKK